MKSQRRADRLLVALVLAGIVALHAPLHAKPGDGIRNGIGGLAWGVNLADLEGLEVLYKKGDALYCVDRNRSYTVEKFNLGYIIYGFYKNKLYSAHVKITELDVYSVVKQKLIDAFGVPRFTMDMDGEIYTWKDKDLKVKLKRSQDATRMKVSFYFAPLSNLLSAGDRKQEDAIRFLPIEKGKTPNMIPLLNF